MKTYFLHNSACPDYSIQSAGEASRLQGQPRALSWEGNKHPVLKPSSPTSQLGTHPSPKSCPQASPAFCF